MSDMVNIIEKNAKLGGGPLADNTDPEYVDKIQSAYIRQDKLLAKSLKEKHASMLAEAGKAFEQADANAFKASMEKLSKMGEMLAEGTDEDAKGYLASFEESKDTEDKKAELSSLAEQVGKIETMLSNVLKGNNVVKFSENPHPAEEKMEIDLFGQLKAIVDKLQKSHTKYGG